MSGNPDTKSQLDCRYCQEDGCKKYAKLKNRCRQHGGYETCEFDGCERKIGNQDFCWKHDGTGQCNELGCENRAIKLGKCTRHGASSICRITGCKRKTRNQGLCYTHATDVVRCVVDGCKNIKATTSFCIRHSPQSFKDRNHEIRKKHLNRNPAAKIANICRIRVWHASKKHRSCKRGKTFDLIGCDAETLRKHLESQFDEEMTWENQGRYGWHIDHFLPVSLFDVTDPVEQKECFHYTNLQPMWATDHLRKGSEIDPKWGNDEASLKRRNESISEATETIPGSEN